MSRYYYLDISLEFAEKVYFEISPEYFKRNIIAAVSQLFGEVAAAVNVDILKYTPETGRAIIRIPADFYVKLRASLSICGTYQGSRCAYTVHKASPLLLSLQGDSRDFQH